MLHLWTSVSIYEALHDFGWFYGDFFIKEARKATKLRYTGIYRYLNNPEKVIGYAAFWGISVICNSRWLYGLTLFGQISTYIFLEYIEGPHMKKLYGTNIADSVVRKLELEGMIDKVRDILPSPKAFSKNASQLQSVVQSDAESNDGENTNLGIKTQRNKSFKNLSEAIDVSKQMVEELMVELERAVDTAFPTLQNLLDKIKVA
jgi:phosphatidylethanolamine N-methyltransferase